MGIIAYAFGGIGLFLLLDGALLDGALLDGRE